VQAESVHWSYNLYSNLFFIADLVIRIGLSIRVIMRQRTYGVSLAWLVVILLFPFAGSFIYLLFGESRLSERRLNFISKSQDHYQSWLRSLTKNAPVSWQTANPEREPIHRQAVNLIGIPALDSNKVDLITTPEDIIHAIIDDINASQSTCHLQFYIWQNGGLIDEVHQALIDAAKRGVKCRLLLDDIGSRDFLRSKGRKELEAAGIKVLAALKAGLYKMIFSRIDIRNHRKIVVIDGKVAYTGSQNMVDPRFFKQDEGYGHWIDLMVRLQGPVVEAIGGTFMSDWLLETDPQPGTGRSLQDDISQLRTVADIIPCEKAGDTTVQLVPSGPGFAKDTIHSLLLTTIYAARSKLTLTTPYFVPDEALLTALRSAAERGVKVKIIIPSVIDSKLVQYASRARYENLSRAGVDIYLFEGGLLHSKTISVDDDFTLFGSVNLDMRSFWLNFETTLFIYSSEFSERIRKTQEAYIKDSRRLDIEKHLQRSTFERFKENLVLLIGPLL